MQSQRKEKSPTHSQHNLFYNYYKQAPITNVFFKYIKYNALNTNTEQCLHELLHT
jgi:hypothetical protein